MTDEIDLQDRLEEELINAYGADAVEREVQLPSNRVCDFVVEAPPGIVLAIEVEHNPDDGEIAGDVIHGAGQAILYASELGNAAPVVVVNEVRSNRAEIEAVARRVPVVEVEDSA